MAISAYIHNFITVYQIPILLITGLVTLIAFYAGKGIKGVKLPSIIGFMIIGVVLGPSLLDVLDEPLQRNLSFITDIALGFVALSIGLELSMGELKRQGPGIILVIFMESFLAFILVTTAVYLLTKDLPLSLIFGAVAPASAPAGTVAVIKEYKARGSLTKALYAVVGFDDSLAIIIFGFAAAFARSILAAETGGTQLDMAALLLTPLVEIGLSLGIGFVIAILYSLLARKLQSNRDVFILTFATVLITTGLCNLLHLSLILTNMVVGFIVANTRAKVLLEKIHSGLEEVMPLLFVLFFVLAGANLHINALPSLGVIGVVYILARSTGLLSGAFLGSVIGKLEPKIKKYLGMGILSQAGVAIGLSLIIKHDFTPLGQHGAAIGSQVITAVTATCIFFEIIGPILTKIGLQKAGEIPDTKAD